MNKKTIKTEEEWRASLTPKQYKITREKGTEKPFTGEYCYYKGKGDYKCVCCGQELFKSDHKYDSGSGWPSFWEKAIKENISTAIDNSRDVQRIEILCSNCDAHLGHVFKDGPEPTGLRYCVNSASIEFVPKPGATKTETAILAAGCFWGVQSEFSQIKGVVFTKVGYTGGNKKDPNYKEVCSGSTGHAEAVRIDFDPSEVSYNELLKKFWEIHNPTTLNRQGPDVGSQYRSAVFYKSEEQKNTAEQMLSELEKSGKFKKKIVTEITEANTFYPAEEYHQHYLLKKGGKACRLK